MNVEQFKDKLTTVENYVINNLVSDILLPCSMTMAGSIVKRVQETGKLAKGNIGRYSTAPILVGRSSFMKQSVWNNIYTKGQKGKDKNTLKWVTIDTNDGMRHLVVFEGGYKRLREIQGRQGKYKDFFYSGAMWKSFDVKSYTKSRVILGARNEVEQKKINFNSKREYQEITAPNKKEIEDLNIKVKELLIKKINDILNS